MSLTQEQRTELYEALLSAFDSDGLKTLTEIRLNEPLEHITKSGSVKGQIRDVIAWAERRNRVPDLVRGAHLENPTNELIDELARVWGVKEQPRQRDPDRKSPLERPPRVEHFIGRETELDKLLADLKPRAVVTLSGPGGIGKTALAAEALWTLAPGDDPPPAFPDGIIFYSFYGRPSVLAACEHIAIAYGEETKPDPAAAAQRALARRTALLVLDGAEQADNLPFLLDLRGGCGVLVTTREREGDDTQVEPLPPDAAAALLQKWAGKWAAGADLAVAGICTHVGWLPLALRLAGAYMASSQITAQEYLDWLKASPFEALHRGPHQHTSIDVLLAKSVAALNERARAALGAVGLLAVQPFDATWITAALGKGAPAAPRLLADLVHYSLLQRTSTGDYVVTHALIHTYSRTRLKPEARTVTRLADSMAGQVETLWNSRKRDFAALSRLRPHTVALVAACAKQKAWAETQRLAWALDEYMDMQGFAVDRVQVIAQALSAARGMSNKGNVSAWLSVLGLAYADLGRVEEAVGYHEQALAIAREIGDRRGEGNDLGNLGIAYRNLGRVEEAIGYYEQALAIRRETGDRRGEGADLGNLGIAYADLGRVDEAVGYYEQALAIDREIGDRRGEGNDLGNLGNAYYSLGRVEEAVGYYEQILVIHREIGDRRGEGNDLGNLGYAWTGLKQIEDALSGSTPGTVTPALTNVAGSEYRTADRLAQSREYTEEALAIDREIGNKGGEGVRLRNLGLLSFTSGNMKDARRFWLESLDIFTAIKSPEAEKTRKLLAALDGLEPAPAAPADKQSGG